MRTQTMWLKDKSWMNKMKWFISKQAVEMSVNLWMGNCNH